VTTTTASTPDVSEDERFMTRALELGRLGNPSPNPHVGAVLTRNGQIIGEGHHERAGQEHAEIAAMRIARTAGAEIAGATLYVTLEPCNHVGRTPPCTEALIAEKVARVVVGTRDPNPNVRGNGVERLRAAGVEVIEGVLSAEATRLVAPWSKCVTTGLPYVSLKLALSLDGRIATRTGESKWVTGPTARQRVHALRAAHDAVAIGIGTEIADDPLLTVRDAPGVSPLRVVFDTKLRTPVHARLVETAAEFPTWIFCSSDAQRVLEEPLTSHGVEVIRSQSSAEGRIDVTSALRLLASRGIVTVMVEGGAELGGSMLAARLVDELHCFIAPILLGPRGRPGAVDWAGPDSPSEAPRIATPRWELCGEDAYVHGPLVYPEK
jgi:diaminohydroxyphosphoribosylaminopyrimidine deaminase / 5-amino-6-(5-phosphoribosylamino)uracil reductase